VEPSHPKYSSKEKVIELDPLNKP